MRKRILVQAYGNPGRRDDGLGDAFARRMERWIAADGVRDVTVDSRFQLNIEHAAAMSEHDIVVFVDASKGDIPAFSFDAVLPETGHSFTTHSLSPPTLLALCTELYGKAPLVYLLQIKGYDWEFAEGLSPEAAQNLENAVKFATERFSAFQNQE